MKKCDALHNNTRREGRGFTLVELMVTVAVVAILLSIGAPQLRVFLEKQQIKADVNQLTSSIHLARSEALKRNGPVSICPLADASSPNPSCDTNVTTRSWSKGWMAFIDYPDSAGKLGVYDAGSDTILQVEQGTRTTDIVSTDVITAITFQAVGIATSAESSFKVGSSSQQCVKLLTASTGRVRTDAC
jgi:type IV fimbrial biogenesis protein FimT